MKRYVVLIVLAVLLVVVLSNLTFFKMAFLVARVTPPYEQVGDGSQSLLLLGDSTGYGTGASKQENSVAGLIGADYPALTITNISVNGRTISQLKDVLPDVNGNYDVILLQIGANDIFKKIPLETSLADIQSILDTLSSRSRHIVMMSSGNVGGLVRFEGDVAARYTEQSRAFRDAMKVIDKERDNFSYVDLFVESEVDPYVLEPDVYVSFDGLHPSDEGYALWYQSLKPVLNRALTELEVSEL